MSTTHSQCRICKAKVIYSELRREVCPDCMRKLLDDCLTGFKLLCAVRNNFHERAQEKRDWLSNHWRNKSLI